MRQRTITSTTTAATWATATSAASTGTLVYNAPATVAPTNAAMPWNTANQPYAVPRCADGIRSATTALIVESCRPVAAPQSATPTITRPRLPARASDGTNAVSSGTTKSTADADRSYAQPTTTAATAAAAMPTAYTSGIPASGAR